jgi:hypothetical protein
MGTAEKKKATEAWKKIGPKRFEARKERGIFRSPTMK